MKIRAVLLVLLFAIVVVHCINTNEEKEHKDVRTKHAEHHSKQVKEHQTGKEKHVADHSNKEKHLKEHSNKQKSLTEHANQKNHLADHSNKEKHSAEHSNKENHLADHSNKEKHSADHSNKEKHSAEHSNKEKHSAEHSNKEKHSAEHSNKEKHLADHSNKEKHLTKHSSKEKHLTDHASKEKHSIEHLNKHHDKEGKLHENNHYVKGHSKSHQHNVKSLLGDKSPDESRMRQEKMKRLHPLLKELDIGTCWWSCHGVTDGHSNNTWTISFNITGSITVTISYNTSANFITTYNHISDIVIIVTGSIEYFGIYNITSDSFIIVEYSTFESYLLTNVNIDFGETTDYETSFALLYEVLLHYSTNSLDTDIKVSDAFNFTTFINQISTNFSITTQQDLFMQIFVSFTDYIVVMEQNGVSDLIGVFEYGMGGLTYLTYSISVIFEAVIQAGGFTVKFMEVLFMYLMKNVTYLSSSFELFISLIANGFVGFYGGLQNALEVCISGKLSMNITTHVVPMEGHNYTFIIGTNQHSWDMNVAGSSKVVTLIYEASVNVLEITNKGMNLTMAFSGNLAMFVLFNLTSGIGVIVDEGTGNARMIENAVSQIVGQANNSVSFVDTISVIIKENSDGLNVVGNDVFKFWTLIEAEIRNDTATIQSDYSNVAPIFNDNFGTFIATLDSLAYIGYTPASLIYDIVQNLIDVPGGFSMNVANLVEQIYYSLDGKFDFVIMQKFRFNIVLNMDTDYRHIADFVLGGLSNAINQADTLTSSLLDFIPKLAVKQHHGFALKQGRSKHYVLAKDRRH